MYGVFKLLNISYKSVYMSKLYKRYNELKATNDNQLYLFKSGMFFIFLDNDAKLISNELNLKLTKLNDNIVKCGFPINSFEKYSNLLKERGFEFSIIDENSSIVTSTSNYLSNIEIVNMINKIKSMDINKTSPIQAFNILSSFKKILGDKNEYENK